MNDEPRSMRRIGMRVAVGHVVVLLLIFVLPVIWRYFKPKPKPPKITTMMRTK